MQKNSAKREKAFLVGTVLRGITLSQVEEQLEELKCLAPTAGADTLNIFTQNRNKPDPATFIGKGKVERIINQSRYLKCNLIIHI